MQRRMETCLSDVRQLFSTEDEQIIDLLEYGISILKRQTKKKADRLQIRKFLRGLSFFLLTHKSAFPAK